MMETAVSNSMCRCCASEGAFKDVKSTYHWMGEEEIYADMLRDCFDINLNVSEQGEDGGICEVCITQLRNSINFKKQVLHTEEQFKKHLQNKTLFRPNIVKVEVVGGEESDDNGSGDDGFSGAEFEVPIKTEEEEPKPKKRSTKAAATTTRAKKAKADNGETSTKRTKDKPIEDTLKVEIIEEDIKDTIKEGIIAGTHTKIGKDTDANKANPKEKPKRKRIRGVLTEIGKARIQMMEEMKKHQTNVKEILMCSNATPFLGKGYIGYMCCYCDVQYPNPAELKKHNLDAHKDQYNPASPNVKNRKKEFCIKLDITNLRCNLCDTNMESLENLLEHLKRDHSKSIFTDINNQLLPFKFNSDSIQCCICPSLFEKFKSLQEHMHTHYRNFICKECDMGFVTQGSLTRHAEKHKLGDFKCSFCTKTYDTKRKVKSHEKSVHILKHVITRCGYCSEKFKTHQKRDEHVAEMHGVEFTKFKCRACDKTFACKRSLTIHTRRDHLMERLHKCGQCDKKFFTAYQLRHHEVKHSGAKEFQCDICLKTYARRKTLVEHIKIHNDDRRFRCEHCGQTFVQKCSLKGHVRHRHGVLV